MQLGTRWAAYTPAPGSLDASVVEAISGVERELFGLKQDTTGWFWTLTYLENRPVVQLDDGTTIRVNKEHVVVVSSED
ncbi:MAG: hypothetical protein RLZZ52_799 [Actinomycetota bacterium]